MPLTCPECGAILPEGNTCQTLFEEFLVLDYTDPDYGAVHFLLVATFMIQHGRYSDEGLAWIQPMLKAFLDGKMTITQIRQTATYTVDSTKRHWKITRPANALPLLERTWSITLVNVTENSVDAETYCEWVKQWASQTLRELAGTSRKKSG